MTIAFDATSLCRKMTGIEYYAFNLLRHLLGSGPSDDFIVLYRGELRPELAVFQSRVRFIRCPFMNQILCEQVWLPWILARLKPDLAHFPAFPPGFLVSVPYVTTVHDAAMWKYPGKASWKNQLYMKPLRERSLRCARRVITVSEASVRDISAYTGTPQDKLINTYQSIDVRFRCLQDKTTAREQLSKKLSESGSSYGLPEKYILSVGSLEPRKNLPALLEAYALLKNEGGLQHKLVLIGRKAWGNSVLAGRIKALGITDDIVMTGYVSDEELVSFYNLAEIFVYPSLYEGFGLPLVEAMACGVPVLTSNVSSLPEVAAAAAYLVDPLDLKAIAGGMRKLLSDAGLRDDLRVLGAGRCKAFSWEKTGELTLAAYRLAGAGSKL